MAYCTNPHCPQPLNADSAVVCQGCQQPLLIDGSYRPLSLLGQGGFGRTYLAELETARPRARLAAGERCVIKQSFGQAMSEPERFRNEADRLRQLGEHRQIPRLYEALETAAGQFLVQEYAPGENLQQQVEKQGPFAEETVRSLILSLTEVLQYVHSFKVIHRDIKPANIVLGITADARSPMLVDFGSAKWVQQSAAQTVIGSAGYAAPEQAMGQALFASDIYSLGLTGLYLLTGVHPFSLYSAVEDSWVWRDYLPKPLESRFAQVLDQMVSRGLQQRYETMAQVELDLQFVEQRSRLFPAPAGTKPTDHVAPLSYQIQKKGSQLLSKLWRPNTQPDNSPALSQLPSSKQLSQHWQSRYRTTADIGRIYALAISPDGRVIASGGSDQTVRLWSAQTGQLLDAFGKRFWQRQGHRGIVRSLAFHPDGRALYSMDDNGTICEWDTHASELLNTLSTPGWLPTQVSVSPDGRQLVCANSDGQLALWEISQLRQIGQLAQHQQQINQLAWAWDSQILVSASDDGTVKLWQVKQPGQLPQLAKTISLPQKRTEALAVCVMAEQPHPSAFILLVGLANQILSYRVDRFLTVSEPSLLSKEGVMAGGLQVVKDVLIAANKAHSLPLLDPWTGLEITVLTHDWPVDAVALANHGTLLAASSADEKITFWQRR